MADDSDLASVDYATLRFGYGTRNTSFSTFRVVDLNQCAPGGLAHHYLWSRSMSSRTYERHYEENVRLPVGADEIFSYADDFSKLSSHMNKPSSMMMGGSMQTSVDQARGQAIGSHVRMKGRMMGIELSLDEVVTERKPPHYKAWETTGRPRLLVIDNYRLGFEITEQDKSSKLRVFIVQSTNYPVIAVARACVRQTLCEMVCAANGRRCTQAFYAAAYHVAGGNMSHRSEHRRLSRSYASNASDFYGVMDFVVPISGALLVRPFVGAVRTL